MKKLLTTDFYEISMVFAHIQHGTHNLTTGFEAFSRKGNLKWIGRHELYNYIQELISELKELNDFNFYNEIKQMVSEKYSINEKIIPEKVYFEKSFSFNISDNFTSPLKPYEPIFQYKGPMWIGLLIETMIINIINKFTLTEYDNLASKGDFFKRPKLIYDPNARTLIATKHLLSEAKEIRKIADTANKIIIEAGCRRSLFPYESSIIALQNYWDATSNTMLYEKYKEKIGGTMSHAWIMSHETEVDAFQNWYDVYGPNTTYLIDTYDTIAGLKTLIKAVGPVDWIRIDSKPLETLAIECRKILDEYSPKTKIMLSGDLDSKSLKHLIKDNIPFDACLIGTRYVNSFMEKDRQSDIVYKLVEYVNKNGERILPEKKSKNKKSISGLKKNFINRYEYEIINDSENLPYTFSPINKSISKKVKKFEVVESNIEMEL